MNTEPIGKITMAMRGKKTILVGELPAENIPATPWFSIHPEPGTDINQLAMDVSRIIGHHNAAVEKENATP